MKMKKFINDPATLTDELLEGFGMAFSDLVEVEGHLVINRALKDADRVTLVAFGGSGHEPAQCGFVGEGMLDIQVVGDIFAAPNPRWCSRHSKRPTRATACCSWCSTTPATCSAATWS